MRFWIGGVIVLLALAALGWLLLEPNVDRASAVRAAPPAEPGARVPVRELQDAPVPVRRYFGSVHDPTWPVAGAGVHATKAGTEERIGSTTTDSKGEFLLEIATRAEPIDILVVPDRATHLTAQFRPGCAPDQHHRFVLKKWRLRGRIHGHQTRGSLRLLIVPAHEYRTIRARDPQAHPSVFRSVAVHRTSFGFDGWFTMPGLPDGAYALVIDSDEWMLEQPLFFRPGDQIEGRVTPSFGVNFEVSDLSTAKRVKRFTVRIEFRDEPTLEYLGNDGQLAFRIPDRARHAELRAATAHSNTPVVHVEAEGYDEASKELYRLRRSPRDRAIWLWPVGEDNVELRVVYDDGGEWDGEVELGFESGSHAQRVKLARIGNGCFTGRLPLGRRDVRVTARPGDRFRSPWIETVHLVAGATWKPTLIRERGGELELDADSKWADVIRSVILERKDAETGRWESSPVSVRGTENVVSDLPPGTYRVTCMVLGRGTVVKASNPRKGVFFNDGTETRWQEFEITPGCRKIVNIDR